MKAYQIKEINNVNSTFKDDWKSGEKSIGSYLSKERANIKADEAFKKIWIHKIRGKVVDPSRRIIGLKWNAEEKFLKKNLDIDSCYKELEGCIQIVIEEIDIEE